MKAIVVMALSAADMWRQPAIVTVAALIMLFTVPVQHYIIAAYNRWSALN